MNLPTERLEQLRAFARIERDAILEREGRNGEDPLLTLIDIPSVDEFVVRELENEMMDARGLLAEFAMARLAGRGPAAAPAATKSDKTTTTVMTTEALRGGGAHPSGLAGGRVSTWGGNALLDVRTSTGADLSFDVTIEAERVGSCLLYTSPSPRDRTRSRMPSSA